MLHDIKRYAPLLWATNLTNPFFKEGPKMSIFQKHIHNPAKHLIWICFQKY